MSNQTSKQITRQLTKRLEELHYNTPEYLEGYTDGAFWMEEIKDIYIRELEAKIADLRCQMYSNNKINHIE